MNDFNPTNRPVPPNRDPLERIVEAFVDLSVPEGPDAAVQLRVVAQATAASLERGAERSVVPPKHDAVHWRRWATSCAQAAAAVAVVALGWWAWSLNRGEPAQNDSSDQGVAAAAAPSAEEHRRDMLALVDRYLRAAVDQEGAPPDLGAMINAVLRDQADPANAERWRRAQERLTVALDQPEVIGLGVGILGTLPWTSYARF
ncbi:MAG TPA: hypothetical protein PKC18_16550 [Lacipirellulaceae bacterium]|nr:hypothetical protein [Lacipirellulaceae bacterium]